MVPGTRPLEELEAALMRVAVNPPASLIEPLEKDERGLVRILKRILPPESNAGRAATLLRHRPISKNCLRWSVSRHGSTFSTICSPRSTNRVVNYTSSSHCVLTFYDRPLQLPKLAEYIKTNTVVIRTADRCRIAKTIVRPAALAGTRFEDGLVADIIDDVHDQPGMLPLLQYALTELFEQHQDDMMTKAAYAALGRHRGCSRHTRAETLYADLSESEQMLTRQLFFAPGDAW